MTKDLLPKYWEIKEKLAKFNHMPNKSQVRVTLQAHKKFLEEYKALQTMEIILRRFIEVLKMPEDD